MGLFDFFKHVDINSELKAMKSIENAVLLDVRSEKNIRMVIFQRV